MSDDSTEGSPEQEASPLVVAEIRQSDGPRASIITLGDRSHGLLSGAGAGNGAAESRDMKNLQGGDIEHQMSGATAEADSTAGDKYAVTELTDRGFILSTAEGHEDVSSEEEEADYEDSTLSAVRGGGATRGDSPSSGSPKDSNILIRPSSSHEYLSGSSDEDSVSAFDRGHQGSYFLRKGARKARELNTSTLNNEENTIGSVSVTPMATLDRSEQHLLDFGSSSDDDSAEAFERDRTHRSLVLKRAKPKKPAAPPTATVLENPVVYANMDDVLETVPDNAGRVVLHPDIRARVERCLHILETEFDPEPKGSVCDPKKCFPCLQATTEPPVPAQLQHMKRMGFKMSPFFFFPALPKFLQDVWVAIELFITFFEFIFACITFGSGGVLNVLVVILSLVNLFLATMDGFFYFIESGSCVSLFKWGRKKLKEGRDPQENTAKSKQKDDHSKEDEHSKENETQQQSCRGRARKWFSVGSEVVRVGLTELLLYPLTILDMFELIGSETYQVSDGFSRINFSLLIIGLFYLTLTVYIIRVFMSISTIVSISRLPKTTNSDYHNLLRKFGLHIIGQIFVHMVVLVMVATKINSEVCESVDFSGSGSGSGGNGMSMLSINTSPFLYVTIFTGDVIPFLGVALYFVVNYPALKQFMMGFCIDMMSTIVAEDFASTAFTGEGIKNVKKKTTSVQSTVDLVSTREQFGLYKNVFSFKKKLAYRLTNPLVLVFSSAYFVLITVFLTCHALGRSDPCDSSSDTSFVTFSDNPGVFVTFIIGLLAITVANYQVVFMCVIWLLTLLGLMVLVAMVPLVALLIAPLIAVIVLIKACI